MYRLREFSWLSGCGKWIGSADSIDGLPWNDLDDLNTYAVYLGDGSLIEFNGNEVDEALTELEDGYGYSLRGDKSSVNG